MEQRFDTIFRAWHDNLVGWTRDRAPKLALILLLAFIFIRFLGIITRKVVELAERTAADGQVRGQEVAYLMTVKVRPGRQFGVARELRRRVKASFEQNHIKSAPAQVFIGHTPSPG